MKTSIKKQGIELSISDNYVIIFGPNISKQNLILKTTNS